MSEKIFGGQLVKVVKQRCEPYQQFFNDKSVTIILFQPPDELSNKQVLAQYRAAVTSTNQKVKTFEFLGLRVNRYELEANTKISQFRNIIEEASKDRDSVGIIVQNPIPYEDLAIEVKRIPPQLDIDGINQTSIFKASATSEAIARLILGFTKNNDCVAVVGSMGFVGSGVVKLLKEKKIQLIELDKTKGDLDSEIKKEVLNADIVVSATGKANLIRADYLKPEHKLVIDAAFIPQADGTVSGDVSKDAYDIPRCLTPVPGGIGPTQMAVLLERIFQVAKIELQPWNYQKDIIEPLQQTRVEKIAPILMDYLEHNQKEEVETDNSVVKYDSDTKTVFYQDKLNSQEYLKAQRLEGKWLDRGSNISQSKESHITSMAAKIAKRQAQISKSAEPKKKKRSL